MNTLKVYNTFLKVYKFLNNFFNNLVVNVYKGIQ